MQYYLIAESIGEYAEWNVWVQECPDIEGMDKLISQWAEKKEEITVIKLAEYPKFLANTNETQVLPLFKIGTGVGIYLHELININWKEINIEVKCYLIKNIDEVDTNQENIKLIKEQIKNNL